MITWLVAGGLAFLLVPRLILRLSRVGEPPLVEGEWQVCQYSGGLMGCVSVIGLLFLFLVGFAYTHPGRTPAGQMLPALVLFAFFGVMGLYSAWQMGRARILWSDREIRSRGVIIPWEELQGANFLRAAQAFQLTGVNGQKIWVYQAMNGFPELWKKVEEFLAPT
ncbi:MAG: hypothetical protein KF760_21825 [Candidatus Eremiobacteraeota bacterium]|nr:hypothetical protein [Candidatus Eremiobacteraeota bacterium]